MIIIVNSVFKVFMPNDARLINVSHFDTIMMS